MTAAWSALAIRTRISATATLSCTPLFCSTDRCAMELPCSDSVSEAIGTSVGTDLAHVLQLVRLQWFYLSSVHVRPARPAGCVHIVGLDCTEPQLSAVELIRRLSVSGDDASKGRPRAIGSIAHAPTHSGRCASPRHRSHSVALVRTVIDPIADRSVSRADTPLIGSPRSVCGRCCGQMLITGRIAIDPSLSSS